MSARLTGHVEELGGDRWRLVVNLPGELRARADGSTFVAYPRRYRQVEARGVRRAQAALDAFRAELEARAFVDPERLTVGALLEAWLELDVEHSVRPKTRERYRQLVRQHLAPGLGRVLVARFQPSDWLAFHRRCRESGRLRGAGGLSEQTCAHLFHVLHRAFEWGIEAGQVDRNPLRRVGRRARPSPEPARRATWSLEQVLAAIELARPTMLYVPAVLAGLAGLRRGEICGLAWSDVDLGRGIVVVRASVEQTAAGLHSLAPKTPSGWREVMVPAMVAEVLREHKLAQDEMRLAAGRRWNSRGLVICRADGSAMPPNALSNRWSEWVRRKRLEPYISFHGLRHSYATELYGIGARTRTVQARLGHSSPAITRALYVHPTEGADLETLALQEARLAEVKAAQDSRRIRDSLADLDEARARKSCK